MDLNTISSLIGSMGFPIFACIILFKQNGEMSKALMELTTTLKAIDTRLSIIEEDKQGGN